MKISSRKIRFAIARITDARKPDKGRYVFVLFLAIVFPLMVEPRISAVIVGLLLAAAAYHLVVNRVLPSIAFRRWPKAKEVEPEKVRLSGPGPRRR